MAKTLLKLELIILLIILSFGFGCWFQRKRTPVVQLPPPKVKTESEWFLKTSSDIYTRASIIIDEKNEEKKKLQLIALIELCELYNQKAESVEGNWNIRCPKRFSMEYLFDKKRFKYRG